MPRCCCAAWSRTTTPAAVGKPFTAAAVELALASYPGFTLTAPPGAPSPYGIYRPAYVDRDVVEHTVHLPDGTHRGGAGPAGGASNPSRRRSTSRRPPTRSPASPTARSPDGCRWARSCTHAPATRAATPTSACGCAPATKQAERSQWLRQFVTVDRVRELLPEAKDLDIEVFELPNLHGVNVLVHGLLGDGVAASTRFDPQAKGLGEWLRSRLVNIPEELL